MKWSKIQVFRSKKKVNDKHTGFGMGLAEIHTTNKKKTFKKTLRKKQTINDCCCVFFIVHTF